VGERASRRRIGPDRPRVDVDRDTEIDLALADRVPEILELESGSMPASHATMNRQPRRTSS
jgi:hypothetical protein